MEALGSQSTFSCRYHDTALISVSLNLVRRHSLEAFADGNKRVLLADIFAVTVDENIVNLTRKLHL